MPCFVIGSFRRNRMDVWKMSKVSTEIWLGWMFDTLSLIVKKLNVV